jgi:nicotinamidase-related amidase
MLSTAALVLIDVQHAIDDPSWGARNNLDAEANIARLLDTWRRRGAPVVHVKHVSRETLSTFRPGQRGVDFKESTAPREGELVIVKHTPSAFGETPLEAHCRGLGIHDLVITGFITNNSIETTVRAASTLGFRVWLVSDATATFDRVDLRGRAWSAEDVHALSLSNMHREYAQVCTTGEVLAAL